MLSVFLCSDFYIDGNIPFLRTPNHSCLLWVYSRKPDCWSVGFQIGSHGRLEDRIGNSTPKRFCICYCVNPLCFEIELNAYILVGKWKNWGQRVCCCGRINSTKKKFKVDNWVTGFPHNCPINRPCLPRYQIPLIIFNREKTKGEKDVWGHGYTLSYDNSCIDLFCELHFFCWGSKKGSSKKLLRKRGKVVSSQTVGSLQQQQWLVSETTSTLSAVSPRQMHPDNNKNATKQTRISKQNMKITILHLN